MPEIVEVYQTAVQLRALVGLRHGGEVLKEIRNHGKRLLWIFETFAYQQHLGMTGRWSWRELPKTKFTLTFVDDDGEETNVHYHDARSLNPRWQKSTIEKVWHGSKIKVPICCPTF